MRSSLKNVMRLIDLANSDVPDEASFLDDLKHTIEEIDSKSARKPSTTYKPSSMMCLRNMWFQVTGAKPDISKNSYTGIGICNAGSDIHNRIQDYITRMTDLGIDCEYIDVGSFIRSRNLSDIEVKSRVGHETKLYHKGLNMSFMTDGIIRYRGKYYILEIKSETASKWYTRGGVDAKHHNQATAYSLAFGLDDVIFLYVNRDMLDMKSYMFHVSDEMRSALVDRIRECDGYKSRMIMPPKPDDVSRGVCGYCPYKGSCH